LIREIKHNGKYRRSEDVVFKEAAGEVIIVPAHRGVSAGEDVLFSLTDSGKLIWSLLDGTRTVEQVIDQVLAHYEAPQDDVKHDVVAFLEELAVRGLITG